MSEPEVRSNIGSALSGCREKWIIQGHLGSAPRHAYSGQCTYCGHCAPCPAGIDIAMVSKLLDLAAMQKEMPPSIREHYNALSADGSDCIGCRGCEKRCPFSVPVVERMRMAGRVFS